MSVNLLGAIADSIASFFHKIIFGIIATMSRIVDVLINFIRIILGLDPLATNENTSISLFDNIVAVNVLQAFGICIAAGFAISLVFALVRAIKSHITEKEEEGVGLWKALRGFFVNAVSFLVIPFFAVCIILATGTVAKVVDNATQDGVSVRASYSSEVVFSTVNESMLEAKGNNWFKGNDEYSLYYENGQPIKGMVAVKLVYGGWERGAKIYHADGSEFRYEETGFSGESDFKVFTDLVDEDAYFDTFILPLLGSCVMLVALAMSAVTIAQRIFSVVFLFILSPLPASFRAFDDGARFKKWAEIFIGKVLSGYGIVFALNVFFSLVPEFTKYDFFYDSFANGCAKLIIYIAGVSFAMGANLLISQFIGGDSLSSERDQTTQNFRAAMSGAHLAGSMTRMAGRATRFAFGHGWGSPYGRYGSAYGGSPYRGSPYYGSPFSGGGEVAQSIGGRIPQQASLGERSGISDAQQGMTAKGSATPLSGVGSGSTPNGEYTARMMGGGLGQAGYDLMKGGAGSAAKHGAKNAGLSLGTTRIGKAVTGTAMFAAGLVTYTARAVGRGARGLWYNTVGRSTAGAERYRAARSAAREERRISKAGARQTAFANASPARQQKMLAKSQRAAEQENVRRERTTASKPPLNAQPNGSAQTGEQNPKRELGKRDLGKKQ